MDELLMHEKYRILPAPSSKSFRRIRLDGDVLIPDPKPRLRDLAFDESWQLYIKEESDNE